MTNFVLVVKDYWGRYYLNNLNVDVYPKKIKKQNIDIENDDN